jgi:hypothetical protein
MSILVLIPLPLQLHYYSQPLILIIFDDFSCQDSDLLLMFYFLNSTIPIRCRDIHQDKSISNEVTLHQLIEGTFATKAWSVVYFNKPGLAVIVNHNVETKHLEAHIVLKVVGLTHTVLMS